MGRERVWEGAICIGELTTGRGSEDVRMGKEGASDVVSPVPEYIGCGGERGEVKHLSTRRKRKQK